MDKDEQLEGGCYCGNVRYQIQKKDYTTINCHCGMCRRINGAPYVAWMVVPKDEFSFTKGKSKDLKSSSHGTRSFCPDCGTPLTCVNVSHPDIVDLTLGSLDHPETQVPTAEIFTDTKLHWTNQIGNLKRIP